MHYHVDANMQVSHCAKSVRIRSYSGPHFFPHFPAFGLNTERYYVHILCNMNQSTETQIDKFRLI